MKARLGIGIFCTWFLAATPLLGQSAPKVGSKQAATDLERVKVGQPAPNFTLTNLDGKPLSLSDYRGKKNVLLVFYRGHW